MLSCRMVPFTFLLLFFADSSSTAWAKVQIKIREKHSLKGFFPFHVLSTAPGKAKGAELMPSDAPGQHHSVISFKQTVPHCFRKGKPPAPVGCAGTVLLRLQAAPIPVTYCKGVDPQHGRCLPATQCVTGINTSAGKAGSFPVDTILLCQDVDD